MLWWMAWAGQYSGACGGEVDWKQLEFYFISVYFFSSQPGQATQPSLTLLAPETAEIKN